MLLNWGAGEDLVDGVGTSQEEEELGEILGLRKPSASNQLWLLQNPLATLGMAQLQNHSAKPYH